MLSIFSTYVQQYVHKMNVDVQTPPEIKSRSQHYYIYIEVNIYNILFFALTRRTPVFLQECLPCLLRVYPLVSPGSRGQIKIMRLLAGRHMTWIQVALSQKRVATMAAFLPKIILSRFSNNEDGSIIHVTKVRCYQVYVREIRRTKTK